MKAPTLTYAESLALLTRPELDKLYGKMQSASRRSMLRSNKGKRVGYQELATELEHLARDLSGESNRRIAL